MRTLTTQQAAVVASGNYTVKRRVWLKPSGGSWVDMTDLEGIDWLQGLDHSGELDNYVETLTVQLWRQRRALSLAPLMANSKMNVTYGTLANIAVEVKVEVAIIPLHSAPQSTDWIEVFLGGVDRSSWAGPVLKLQCRDQGRILNQMIEAQAIYPKAPRSEHTIEGIMQEILDDNGGTIDLYSVNGTGGTPWNTADSPGVNIKQYIQSKQTIIQALRALNANVAWQVGYRWHSGTSAFQLMFYDPGREVRARGTITHTGQPNASDGVRVNTTTKSNPGDWAIGSTVLETAVNIAAALDVITNVDAWAVDAEPAIGTMTFSGVPASGEVITLDATTFTEGVDWNRDTGSAEVSLENLIIAVKASTSLTTIKARKSGNSRIKFEAVTKGTAGNSLVFTAATGTNLSLDGGGTLGGSQLGKNIKTVVEWSVPGTSGNAVVFDANPSLANATFDGGGTLGGTVAGASVTVARTFGPNEYDDISEAAFDIATIRNAIEVIYGRDPENRGRVIVTDSASISAFSRWYMAASEASSSYIDTLSEARTYANGMLDDLKDPTLVATVSMPYFPWVQIGDYYTFSANGVHSDSDQSLAVVGFKHTLSGDGRTMRTVLSCRGKPAGGLYRWLRLEARGGVSEPNRDITFDAPAYAAISSGMSSVEITIEDPRRKNPPFLDWKRTRVYMSTSTGFTPSTTNLVIEGGKQTQFTVTGLVPGGTYYFRLSFVDIGGNESYYSEEISAQTQMSSPYHEDPQAYSDAVNKNADFGVRTLGTGMPDSWEVTEGTFGTDINWLSSDSESGGYCMQIDVDATNEDRTIMASGYIPTSYWNYYVGDLAFKYTGTLGSGSADYIGFYLSLYDKDKNLLVSERVIGVWQLGSYSTGTWYTVRGGTTITTSSARYVRVRLRCRGASSGSPNWSAFLGRAAVRTAPAAHRVFRSGSGVSMAASAAWPGSKTWTTIINNATSYAYGTISHNTTTGVWTILRDGTYTFYAVVAASTFNVADVMQLRFNVNGGTNLWVSPIHTSDGAGAGASTIIAVFMIQHEFVYGDTMTLEAAHSNGGAITTTYGTDTVFVLAKGNQPT